MPAKTTTVREHLTVQALLRRVAPKICTLPCLSCHTVPCHAMPCHAMPCHAMPCHAMPYHSLLLCAVRSISLQPMRLRRLIPVHGMRTYAGSSRFGSVWHDSVHRLGSIFAVHRFGSRFAWFKKDVLWLSDTLRLNTDMVSMSIKCVVEASLRFGFPSAGVSLCLAFWELLGVGSREKATPHVSAARAPQR